MAEQINKSISEERELISKAGKLHWIHWGVVVLSLFVTLGAWNFSRKQINEKIEAQFEREADQVIELVSERMKKYEDGLWAGVSAIQTRGGDVSLEDWRTFARSIRIDTKYPGINGIGVIHNVKPDWFNFYLEEQRKDRPGYTVHPQHGEEEFWPITYIEPASTNAQAVGLDMAHENNRYSAAKKARDTGTAQITGPITLVQDAGRTPGFLFFAPFYDGGFYASLEDRRKHFKGLVYAPFVVKKLLEGTLEKERRNVGLSIADGSGVLYDEHVDSEPDFDPDPLYTKTFALTIYGRVWEFDIWSARSFREAASSDQPLIILLGGILIDALLFCLFILLTRSNRNAIAFADRMTAELKEQTKSLVKSNEELEKFAYITSHDLKTPLRGIGDLKEYLEEDLEDYLGSADANPDIAKNLGRLDQQVMRMDNLIKGILDYSRAGAVQAELIKTDFNAMVNHIGEELGLGNQQLVIQGKLPPLLTDAVQLDQILSNLIGNAIKYHHDPDSAKIIVSSRDIGRFYEITVADNGPGIDAKFHHKIFEAFQSLQPKDEIESTGIGLSIVKKAVESHHGSITVSSEPGKGAAFKFTWPKNMRLQPQLV